jgi:succinoglycan biosynthesis protein ExoA
MPLIKETKKMPFVSVVMPVRNEANYIERSLRAVFSQNYSPDSMEIIVADGDSTDATVSTIENLKQQTKIPLKVVSSPRKTAPYGLNLAIREACGEIVIRVDGHCEIAPDYVANCVRHLGKGDAEAVGGAIETVGETLTAEAVAVAMSSGFGVGGSAFRCAQNCEMYVDTVAFPAYRRAIFERIGLYNEELTRNQDDEFNYRLRKYGGKVLLAPDVRVRYYSRSNLRSLWRQYFQYGFWKVRVLQMHPKQMSLRQFVPFCFVSAIAILTILSLFSAFGRIALALVFGLYISANLTATLNAARRIKFNALPLVFLSFAILHFAYGFGFAAGLYNFRRAWRSKKIEAATHTAS